MKQILFLLFVCLLVNPIFSQKKAIDLSVLPLSPDSTVQGDSTKLLVQFKLNYPDSVQNIQIKFGTVQDSANVGIINPSIIFSNDKYFTFLNGNLNEINDYDARVYYVLSEAELNSYFYLTLVLNYIDGTADTLYWLKQDQNP